MKVIFLDIDGVLIPTKKKRSKSTGFFPYSFKVSPSAIKNLQYLISQSDAKIVISSSWVNNLSLKSIFVMLSTHGFEGPFVLPQDLGRPQEEQVQAGDWLDQDCYKFHGTTATPRLLSSEKTHEIGLWLADYKTFVSSYVVLDDHLLDLYKANQVTVNPQKGLTKADVQKALDILNRKPS